MERGGEYPSHIVEAMTSGEPDHRVRHDQERRLGRRTCCPTTSSRSRRSSTRDGIHPQPFGSLPPQLAALVRRHHEFNDLAVTAMLDRDRELAVQALMLDPLTSAVCEPADIREMFDEMVAAERDDLPSFLDP